MTCVVSRRVRIPKSLISKHRVLVDLVISGTQLDYLKRSQMVCFQELLNNYLVPKAYGLQYIREKKLDFNTIIPSGTPIDVSFKGNLRKEQVPVVEDAMKSLINTEGAVLNLYCGFGKTTCANMISTRLGVKTLVLVHTTALATQWKERIEQFVDGCSVGMIRQETFDVEGRTHVIGLMQSISKRNYAKGSFDSFGLMIIDECHHVCAESLSKCIAVAGSKYRLGLSATPFRKDGFHPFLYSAIGKIASTVQRQVSSQDLLVESMIITNGPSRVYTIKRGGKTTLNMPKMLTELCQGDKSGLRTNKIVECIKTKYLEGRHIIVLSDRREHLRRLHKTLQNHGVTDVGFMVGGQKPHVNKKTELCKVILSTYAFTSEGVDIPSLDTAVFATPRSDVVQTTGRILRTHDSKKTPLVIDVVDSVSVFVNQYRNRELYYESLGGDITFIDENFDVISRPF